MPAPKKYPDERWVVDFPRKREVPLVPRPSAIYFPRHRVVMRIKRRSSRIVANRLAGE